MSTFSRFTRHPQTKMYEKARWIDDYFAPHVYGVHFKSDDKVYPVELVDAVETKELWAEDVIRGIQDFFGVADPHVLEVLEFIDEQYKARWERDSVGGEGAVEYYQSKFKGGK